MGSGPLTVGFSMSRQFPSFCRSLWKKKPNCNWSHLRPYSWRNVHTAAVMIHQAGVKCVGQWDATCPRQSTYNLLLHQHVACKWIDTYLYLNGLPGPNIQMLV